MKFSIKRGIFIFIFSSLLFSIECYAKDFSEINIYENGRTLIELQNTPFLKDDILYLPLREMAEHYGAGNLRYEKPNIIIEQYAPYDGKTIIIFTPDDEKIIVNQATAQMFAPPVLKDGYTYISTDYLPWINMGSDFFVNYECLDDTLNVYLRNNILEDNQKNWVDLDFDLKNLTKSNGNNIISANSNVTLNLTWEYDFQSKEQHYFIDADNHSHLVDFIITSSKCKFYTEPGVQAVTIPFSQEYEMTFITADAIDNDLLNRIYKYQDSYVMKASAVSIPAFSITDENKTYFLNEHGFFCQNIVTNNKKNDVYALEKNKIDYTFQNPFYFIITDKKTKSILYKGWYGFI